VITHPKFITKTSIW